MTGPAVGDRLDPDAPHPPFAWAVGLPSGWALLDTAPATWQRSAARLVDDRFAGRSLRPAERRAVHGFVEQLVSDCRQAGAVLSVLRLGRLSTGGVGSAGLHLRWYDSAPAAAGLAAARDGLPRTGVAAELDTPLGPALLHDDVVPAVPPGATDRVRCRVLQAHLPVPGTTWTALFSAATAHPELAGPLAAVFRPVARSLRVWTGAGPQPDRWAGTRAAGPGIGRGFGTLLAAVDR